MKNPASRFGSKGVPLTANRTAQTCVYIPFHYFFPHSPLPHNRKVHSSEAKFFPKEQGMCKYLMQ